MKDETLASPIYHGFLPPKSRERQIDLTPRLYTQSGEKIHLTFLPLRPDCGNDPQWEDWERWILLVRDCLPSLSEKESAFLFSVLEWIETALTYTTVMVVESNL